MSNRKSKKGAFSDVLYYFYIGNQARIKLIAQENRDIVFLFEDDSIDGFIRKLVELSKIEAHKVNSNSLSYSLLEQTIQNSTILKPLFGAKNTPQKRTINTDTKIEAKKPKYIIEHTLNTQTISESEMKTPDTLLKDNLIPDYKDQWNFGLTDDYSL